MVHRPMTISDAGELPGVDFAGRRKGARAQPVGHEVLHAPVPRFGVDKPVYQHSRQRRRESLCAVSSSLIGRPRRPRVDA